jgi:hypothetical protein
MDTEDTATIPVTPPVHVEQYASHTSLSWTANGIEQFVAAVRTTAGANTPIVVDATNAAGRRRLGIDEIDTTTAATTYVRVEPDRPWTLAWDRRSDPVVTLTGTPRPATARRFHVETTDCDGWDDTPRSRLQGLLNKA